MLSAIKAPGEGVASLLACLPSEDFALDVHICSYGEALPAVLMNPPTSAPSHTVRALCARHSPSDPLTFPGRGTWVWAGGCGPWARTQLSMSLNPEP